MPASALILLLWTAACRGQEPAGSASYTPMFTRAAEAARGSPAGTIAFDFAEAGSAKTLDEAIQRWENFLKQHPPDADTEDAVEKRYIDAALYELARAYYLVGRRADGDRLIEQADPLQLR
jgi:hypothetical protein